MTERPSEDVPFTELIRRAGAGDEAASRQVLPQIYAHLKQVARRQLRNQGREAMLSTTVLAHEAWLGLMARDGDAMVWADRAHFYRYSARAIRNILVDHFRSAGAEKRGGGQVHVELGDTEDLLRTTAEGVLELNSALERLGQIQPRLVDVVELKFFVGLDVDAIAQALDLNPRTVIRDWRKARLLLKEMLGSSPA